MRVALICPTIGQTRRGYERYFSDLFRFLSDRIDIVLFKGGGAEMPGERVVPHFSRTGILSRICGNRLRYPRFKLEFASFAVSIAPVLASGHFDLVHFIDPPLGPHFARLRRLARVPVKLLFSNAGPLSYDASRWVDHIHCLSPLALEEAKEIRIPPERLSLVPMGVDPGLGRSPASSDAARQRFGLQPGNFVVLAIASVNRQHKRVDYLIQEVAAMEDDTVLWLDGSLHPDGDPALIEMGRRLLGDRFRYTHMPSETVPELLAMADVFVSAATYESFGMAISEAMASEVPVIVHDSAHFQWLVQGQGHRTDMGVPGNLTAKLRHLKAHRDELMAGVDRRAVYDRFGWPQVAQAHLEMYQKVLGMTANSSKVV